MIAAPSPIGEMRDVTPARFHEEIRPAARPVVMRGLVEHWPAVAAARGGDAQFLHYLVACNPVRPVMALFAMPEEGGRFFYNRQMTGFNFGKGEGQLADFLRREGKATLSVPGGTTPGPIFDTLSGVDLDWANVAVVLNDERWVPESSDRSNTRLTRSTGAWCPGASSPGQAGHVCRAIRTSPGRERNRFRC